MAPGGRSGRRRPSSLVIVGDDGRRGAAAVATLGRDGWPPRRPMTDDDLQPRQATATGSDGRSAGVAATGPPHRPTPWERERGAAGMGWSGGGMSAVPCGDCGEGSASAGGGGGLRPRTGGRLSQWAGSTGEERRNVPARAASGGRRRPRQTRSTGGADAAQSGRPTSSRPRQPRLPTARPPRPLLAPSRMAACADARTRHRDEREGHRARARAKSPGRQNFDG